MKIQRQLHLAHKTGELISVPEFHSQNQEQLLQSVKEDHFLKKKKAYSIECFVCIYEYLLLRPLQFSLKVISIPCLKVILFIF